LHTSKVKQRLHNLNKQALKGTLTVDQQVTVAAEIIVTEE
jgi:hypothetical protein